MKEFEYVLLDGFMIASFPQILSLNSSYFKLLTTTHVVEDIRHGYGITLGEKARRRTLEAIEVSHSAGILDIRSMNLESSFTIFHGRGSKQLSSSETSLIDLANILKNTGTVQLATISEGMLPIARRYDLELMNLDDLIGIYGRTKGINAEEIKFEVYYSKSDLMSIPKKVAIGILIAGVLIAGYLKRSVIVGEFNALIFILGSVIIAVLFFILRERQRIVYGVVEFLVGITSVILIFYPTFQVSLNVLDFTSSVKFLGGIYIMIRGLDNLLKGMSKTNTGRILKYKYKIGL